MIGNTQFYSFFVFLNFFFSSIVWGQNDKIANLESQINKTTNDSIRVDLMLQLCLEHFYDYSDSLQQVAGKALSYIDKTFPNDTRFVKSKLQLFILKGHDEQQKKHYKKAKTIFSHAVNLAQKFNQKGSLAEIYSHIASLYAEQEQYDSTTVYDLRSLEIREATNSSKLGSSYNNLGYDYKMQGQFRKALDYYLKAIHYKKKNNLGQIGNTYLNIGNIYQKINQVDSSFYYYNLALEEAQTEKDSSFIGQVLHNVGLAYSEQQDYAQAKIYLLQSIELINQLGLKNDRKIIPTYQEMAKVHINLNELDAAEQLLKLSESILQDNDMKVSSFMEMNFKTYESLYWKKKDFEKARIYAQQSYALNDTLHNRAIEQKVFALLADYEDQLKEKKIESLEQQQKITTLENEKISRQVFSLTIVIILMIITLAALFWLNRWRASMNDKLQALNDTKDKLFSIIAHDLKNPLSAFRSITQAISDDILEISREDLEYFIKQLNNSANSLYDLLQNLLYWSIAQSGRLDFTPEQSNLNLIAQQVIELLQSSAHIKKIQINNDISNELTAYADSKMVHTILRNLAANAIKFTPIEGTIEISAQTQGEYVTVQVKDNGVGMSTNTLDSLFKIGDSKSQRDEVEGKGTGLGLLLCKELVERQGGKIEVQSTLNQGSIFTFTLPIHKTI